MNSKNNNLKLRICMKKQHLLLLFLFVGIVRTPSMRAMELETQSDVQQEQDNRICTLNCSDGELENIPYKFLEFSETIKSMVNDCNIDQSNNIEIDLPLIDTQTMNLVLQDLQFFLDHGICKGKCIYTIIVRCAQKIEKQLVDISKLDFI